MIPISKLHYKTHTKKKSPKNNKSFTAEDKTIQDISICSVRETFFSQKLTRKQIFTSSYTVQEDVFNLII